MFPKNDSNGLRMRTRQEASISSFFFARFPFANELFIKRVERSFQELLGKAMLVAGSSRNQSRQRFHLAFKFLLSRLSALCLYQSIVMLRPSTSDVLARKPKIFSAFFTSINLLGIIDGFDSSHTTLALS